jgi:hypothetical protein
MEMLLFGALLAGLVWGVIFYRRLGWWGMLLATLIAGTFFGHFFFHLGPATSDRLLLLGCVVIHAVHRHLGLHQPKRWNISDTLVALLAVTLIGTTFVGNWRAMGMEPFSKLTLFYLLPMLAYWLARQTDITPERLRALYAVFAAVGLYLAGTAVAEKMEFGWAIFPRYIADPNHAEFLGRGRGPMMNPAANGVLLTFGMVCTLVGVAYGSRLRWWCLAVLPVYLAGIYSTLTRCVWIGGAGALAGCTYLMSPARWRLPLLLAMFAGGGLVVAAKSESFVSFKRDKNVSEAEMRQSAQLRPILAMIAWRMFEDRPCFGCGTAQYLTHVGDYLGDRDIDLPLVKAKAYIQHNIFLALLSENGLAGMLPFTALLCLWTAWGYLLWADPGQPLEYRQLGLVFLGFMCGYLVNGMFHDVLVMPMLGSYLFFLAGCVRSLREKCQRPEARPRTILLQPARQTILGEPARSSVCRIP